jgi:hypothetical protein
MQLSGSIIDVTEHGLARLYYLVLVAIADGESISRRL